MYNVLIVDDEGIDREGLKRYVMWESMGYQVIGDAESAAKALKIIENEKVDVLLTDIMMPETNGIELVKKAKKICPSIKTIILSGYEEFQYAQEAIRLGAFDYITKPVVFKDLAKILLHLKVILENEERSKKTQKEYSYFLCEQFFNNLAKGFYKNIADINRKSNELDLDIGHGRYCIARLLIQEKYANEEKRKPSNELSTIRQGIGDIFSRVNSKAYQYYVFENDIGELAIMFCSYTNNSEVQVILERINHEITNYADCLCFIGVGREYSSIINISDSYSEAGKALEYRVIKKYGCVLYFDDLNRFFAGKSMITEEEKTDILYYLTKADEINLIDYVLYMLNNVQKEDRQNESKLIDAGIEIFLAINKFIASNVDKTRITPMKDSYSLKILLQKDKFEDIKEFMIGYIKKCITIIRDEHENTAGRIIDNAKKYINEHFNEEISLNRLSAVVYVHPIYLSKLFKEKTDENFIDYLTRVRIERARELLSDLALKIYDISEMVGYRSPKHFSKLFKEIVGITPKEYRNGKSF